MHLTDQLPKQKVTAVNSVIAELENKGQKSSNATTLSICINKTKRECRKDRNSNSGRGRGIGSGSPSSTQEVCSLFDYQGHLRPNCLKKYPEIALNSHKKDNATQKGESSRSNGKSKKDRVVFNLATIANSADLTSDS